MEQNFILAREKGVPICQDTGMAVVFLRLGQEVHITGGSLQDAVNQGVHRGYVDGHLRCSVVADPLRRVNTGDNTPAVLHVEVVPGDEFTVTLAPKGFGSENMSAMKMFTPAATRETIEDWIASCVDVAGSNPCPPVIVGVGLGGTIEQCALEAKKALLAPMDQPNPNEYYQDMEQKTLEKINRLGIGPQGMGGRVTALAVHIRPTATHIAGLPCVVNMSCHVTRHAAGSL
jgi:fumarate hydratase subunit alpha